MPVHFLCLWVDDSLLFECLFLDASCFSLLEHLGFLNEGSLELCWLWVEFVIVAHLLVKVILLKVSSSKSAEECKVFDLSNIFVEPKFRWDIHLVDLSELEYSWDSEKSRDFSAVSYESLILQDIFILQGLFTRVKESEVVKIFMGIGHCLFF